MATHKRIAVSAVPYPDSEGPQGSKKPFVITDDLSKAPHAMIDYDDPEMREMFPEGHPAQMVSQFGEQQERLQGQADRQMSGDLPQQPEGLEVNATGETKRPFKF